MMGTDYVGLLSSSGDLLISIGLDTSTGAVAGASSAVMGVPSAVAGALLSVQPAVLPLPLSSGLTFYSENPFVSHALLARRWRELAAPSRECSLIWTVKTTDVDFKTLSRGQLCNHFERCALTTKVGLLECLHDETRRPAATVTGSTTGHGVSAVVSATGKGGKGANSDGGGGGGGVDELAGRVPVASFFPRSYDLSDEAQLAAFTSDFHLTAAAALLHRYCAYGPSEGDCQPSSAHYSASAVAVAREGAETEAGGVLLPNGDAAAAGSRAVPKATPMRSKSVKSIAVHRGASSVASAPAAALGAAGGVAAALAAAAAAALPSGVPLCLVESALAAAKHVLGHPSGPDTSARGGARPQPTAADLAAISRFVATPEPPELDGGDCVRAERRARHSGEHALALYAQARLVLEQLRSSTAQMCFEALDGRRNVWVLKPSYGSKGVGVRLLNGDDGLSAVLSERDSRRVVQKYVERPLLIGGYKFDIRCWVIVTEWSPQLRAWFYDDDVLLRFCSDAFDLDELHNRFGHITNRTVQQERCAERSRPGTALSSASGLGGGLGGGLGSGSMMGGGFASSSGLVDRFGSSSALGLGSRPARAQSARPVRRSPAQLAAAAAAEKEACPLAGALGSAAQLDAHLSGLGLGAAWSESVLPRMRAIAAATLQRGAERAEAHGGAGAHGGAHGWSSSFEIFGLDMVLDETLHPWLVEVNEAPNLSAHGSALKELILQPMLSAAVELVVEPEHRRAPPERVGGWHRL